MWFAAEGLKLDVEMYESAKNKSGSLSDRLKRTNRGGGITATELQF